MAIGWKPLKLNKDLALVGLLFLCVLVVALLLLGVFTRGSERDASTEPASPTADAGIPNPGEEHAITSQQEGGASGGSAQPAHQSPETDPAHSAVSGGNADWITPEEDPVNVAAGVFSPSELKRLRDPFQSLVKKPQPSSDTAGVTEEPANTQQPQGSGKSTAGTGKTADQKTNTAAPYTDAKKTGPDRYAPEPEIRYPAFTLAGIVSQAGTEKAILTTKSSSYIVGKGEYIQDWLIEGIEQSAVRISNGEGQRFIMTFEGVTVDEGKK